MWVGGLTYLWWKPGYIQNTLWLVLLSVYSFAKASKNINISSRYIPEYKLHSYFELGNTSCSQKQLSTFPILVRGEAVSHMPAWSVVTDLFLLYFICPSFQTKLSLHIKTAVKKYALLSAILRLYCNYFLSDPNTRL